LWATAPDLRVEGLAEAVDSAAVWDPEGKRWQYELRYLTGALKTPIGIDQCKQVPALKSASFLKSGPMGTFYPLEPEQAAALFAEVRSRNSGLRRLWTELQDNSGRFESHAERSAPAKAPFTQAQYVNALRRIGPGLSEGQRLMLSAHAAAPNRYLDVVALARAAGSRSQNYTFLQYGRLGHLIVEAIGSRRRVWVWTRVLAEDARDPITGRVGWTLHREVAAALHQLGWKNGPAVPDPLEDAERVLNKLPGLSKTTRDQLVQARLGQGDFRRALIAYWRGCAVTGCDVLEALKASHIKPWRHSTQIERLSPVNGLLLMATLDALFDVGLISFDDDGAMRISKRLGKDRRRALGLLANMRLQRVDQGHRRFLRWHRARVFRAK
jgi:hypothetical protein